MSPTRSVFVRVGSTGLLASTMFIATGGCDVADQTDVYDVDASASDHQRSSELTNELDAPTLAQSAESDQPTPMAMEHNDADSRDGSHGPADEAQRDGQPGARGWDPALSFAWRTISEGRKIFRNDTFGDEAFWGGALRLHEAIAGEANGGVGDGISPNAALGLGLKVDSRALGWRLRKKVLQGQVDLDDPATTLALLERDAVIGLKGFFDEDGQIESLGVTCALCHTQVDDSFVEGIGHRRDGWPNRDLDIGTIIAAAPDLTAITELLGVDDPTLRSVLSNWGRGKFDAFVFLDGKAVKPDGSSAAVTIPPVFGLNGVGLVTWNGFGSLASWVPLVANVEIHGMGTFSDRRLGDPDAYPVADAAGFDRIRTSPDLITSKLGPLQYFMLSLEPPKAPAGSYDEIAAEAGEELFNGKARCSGCHVPPLYTLPGWNVVPGFVVGVDSFQSDRSPAGGYRVPPLRGLFTREGGYFHDGRFASVDDVVEHFNGRFNLSLTDDEKYELGEFLRSL